MHSFRYMFYKIIYLKYSLKILEYNKYLSPGFFQSYSHAHNLIGDFYFVYMLDKLQSGS